MKPQMKLLYSPRIKDTLIPKIYGVARAMKKPMTEIVNSILEREIDKMLPATGPLEKEQC
ncbi:MAG: hypothetical protein ABII64_02390 [Elusimicrobiota bacterium]